MSESATGIGRNYCNVEQSIVRKISDALVGSVDYSFMQRMSEESNSDD